MTAVDKLATYYARRAAEYERFYDKPERLHELAALKDRVAALVAGKRVLELACGTGYWTKVMAAAAARVDAFDLNDEVLEVARAKDLPPGRVSFCVGNAYQPADLGRTHDALYAGFWWSHVLLKDLDAFLRKAVNAVAPGATIAFVDNRYVEGSSTPLSRRDTEGNTYQMRKLDDGSTHEVLKNFPTDDELLRCASAHGSGARVENFKYFWLLSWRAPA